jgi:hypothetical protein
MISHSFRKLFTERTKGVILGALGITLALGVRDLVADIIDTVYGSKNDIPAKVFYVVFVFIVVLLYSMWTTRDDVDVDSDELQRKYNCNLI